MLTKGFSYDNIREPFGGLAQLARALALQARGHRFEPDILHQLLISKAYTCNVYAFFVKENHGTIPWFSLTKKTAAPFFYGNDRNNYAFSLDETVQL